MIYQLDIVSRKNLKGQSSDTFNLTTWVSSDSALDGIKEEVEDLAGRDLPFVLVVNPHDNGGNTQLFFPELTGLEREAIISWLIEERLTYRTSANAER